MRVINVHKRLLSASSLEVEDIFSTLSSNRDLLWPHEKCPKMKLNNGLQISSEGGHGPIKYFLKRKQNCELIEFQFTKPKGFIGVRRFEIKPRAKGITLIIHTIEMRTKGIDSLKWAFAIRWLHDALIEDCFDKLERNLGISQSISKHSRWVVFLRFLTNRIVRIR